MGVTAFSALDDKWHKIFSQENRKSRLYVTEGKTNVNIYVYK